MAWLAGATREATTGARTVQGRTPYHVVDAWACAQARCAVDWQAEAVPRASAARGVGSSGSGSGNVGGGSILPLLVCNGLVTPWYSCIWMVLNRPASYPQLLQVILSHELFPRIPNIWDGTQPGVRRLVFL